MNTKAPTIPPVPAGQTGDDLITTINDRLRRIQALVGSAGVSGEAGGDLAGTFPDPTVVQLQGRKVSKAAPGAGQVLKWSGVQWTPAAIAAGSAGSSLQSPLDFGGVGDGNPATGTGTDDTTAVRAAAALGYLWLPPGKIFVTEKVTFTNSNFCIFGGGGLMLKAWQGTDLVYVDGSAFTGVVYPANGIYGHIDNVLLHGNAYYQDTVGTTIAANIAISTQTVTPAAMSGTDHLGRAWSIRAGMMLLVSNADGSNSEMVEVLSTTSSTFTAVFRTPKTGPGIQVTGSVGACVVLRNAAYTTMQDCLIYAAGGDGLRLENWNGNYQADECNILNNRVFANGQNGIHLLPVTDPVSTTIAAAITGGTAPQAVTPASMANIAVGATLVIGSGGGQEWVVILGTTGTTFTAVFVNSHAGGAAVASTAGHVGDHVIVANHCNYNYLAGIRGTRLTSTIIALNNILTNNIGCYLDAADRVTLQANACRNNKGLGLGIDQDQTGNGFGRSKQILIQGNELHYNGVTSAADELDVWNTDGCEIVANKLGDTDFTATAQYGIQLYNATGIVIAHNLFDTFVHSALLANSVPYVAIGNVGLQDLAWGEVRLSFPGQTGPVPVRAIQPNGAMATAGLWAIDYYFATVTAGGGAAALNLFYTDSRGAQTASFAISLASTSGLANGRLVLYTTGTADIQWSVTWSGATGAPVYDVLLTLSAV